MTHFIQDVLEFSKREKKALASSILLSFVILSCLGGSAYYFTHLLNSDVKEQIRIARQEQMAERKRITKDRIENLIYTVREYIKIHPELSTEEKKRFVLGLLINLRFDQDENNYAFIYDVHSLQGGEAFATMLLNPNRPELEQQTISSFVKDANGKKYRQEMLEQINLMGDAFVRYQYKSVTKEGLEEKISYFHYFPEWSWIFATGIYESDIEERYAKQVEQLESAHAIQLNLVTLVFGILSLVTVCIIIFIVYLQRLISREKTAYFKKLNHELEQKIDDEVLRRITVEREKQDQEILLVRQSKMAMMGEMLGVITHQWKQPLTIISMSLGEMLAKCKVESDQKPYLSRTEEVIMGQIGFMNQTIEDFKEFFNPRMLKRRFQVSEAISFIRTNFVHFYEKHGIQVLIDIQDNFMLKGLPGEFEHVIFNIMNNAKEELERKEIAEKRIALKAYVEGKKGIIVISDNAGGIPPELLPDKIYEHSVSLKDEGGSGIGLYITKLIVENKMNGTIEAKNTDEGAEFIIFFPLTV